MFALEKSFELLELSHFYAFARQRWQLDLSIYNQSSVRRRLSKMMYSLRLNNLPELIDYMSNRPNDRAIFLNHFTVQVTELFREPDTWRGLVNLVFPLWQDRKEIKVLHVGCSSGEEVLSLAILAHQDGLLPKMKITASDINPAALERVFNASISRSKIPIAEMNYRKAGGMSNFHEYYQANSSMVFFMPWLLEKVETSVLDISHQSLQGEFDLVICKNTLIYFNSRHQNKIIKNLLQHLRPNGFISIGLQDSLIFYENHLTKMHCISKQGKIFRKR